MSLQSHAVPRIAVIGAGMAGLACANALSRQGVPVVVFDKSRGLGGRMAARRVDGGASFDHGAQYVTARSFAFKRYLDTACAVGAASPWQPVQAEFAAIGETWFTGTPAMKALVKPLADGLEIHRATQVTAVSRDGSGWRLATSGGGDPERFDFVVCTTPAPQAQALLAAQHDIAAALGMVTTAPCWALMVSFATPVRPGFDVRQAMDAPIAWLARSASKPGRQLEPDCWVVHASPAWSRAHLEAAPDDVARRLLDLLPGAFATALPEVEHIAAHRWRYARTTTALGQPYLRSADGTLLLGGDWCLGARVEYAFASGRAIAAELGTALAA